jgi:cupin 2 domain-containing protein
VVAPTVRHSRLLQDLPTALDAEQVDELLQRPNLRIERIVSTGQASAKTFWYDQAEHEWVIVLSGRAKLRYEHEYAEVELGPGDAAFIPAHTRHQVAWTTPDEPTVWLAFFWTEA